MKNPRLVWHPFGLMKQTIIFKDNAELLQQINMLVNQQVWFDVDFVKNGIVGIVTEPLK